MTRDEFKKRYVDYMVAQTDLTREEAEENFEAGDVPDAYYIDPEGAASDEISYWGEG